MSLPYAMPVLTPEDYLAQERNFDTRHEYLDGFAYLMAGGYVLLWDEHIRVDILYSRLTPRNRAWMDFVLFFVFYFPSTILVMYTAWPFFRNSFTVLEGSPDPGGIPARWALKGVIIAAFGIMVVQGLSEVIKRFYWAKGWEEPPVRRAPER